jgi:hypothetical protein
MSAFRFAAAGLAVVLMLASNSFAQKEASTTKSDGEGRYTRRANHDPNGIGKFYMGREIAHVMGFSGARWLERTER